MTARPHRSSRVGARRTAPLDLLLVAGVVSVIVGNVLETLTGPAWWLDIVSWGGSTLVLIRAGLLIHRPFVAAAHGRAPAVDVGAHLLIRVLRVLPLWWAVLLTHRVLVGGADGFDLTDHLVTAPLLQAIVPEVRTAVVGPAWILSATWIFGLLAPAGDRLVRFLRLHLDRSGSPDRTRLIVLVVLIVFSAPFTAARPFLPMFVGAILATVEVHRSTRRRRPSRSTPDTAVPLGARILGTATTLSLGLLLWHDPILRWIVRRIGSDASPLPTLQVTIVGGLVLAFAGSVLVDGPMRTLLHRLLHGRSAPDFEWDPADPILRVASSTIDPATNGPSPVADRPRRRFLDAIRVFAVIVLLISDAWTGLASGFLDGCAFIAAAVLVASTALSIPRTMGERALGRRLADIAVLYWIVLTIAHVRGELSSVRGAGSWILLIVGSPLPDPAVLWASGRPVTSLVLIAMFWSAVLAGLHELVMLRLHRAGRPPWWTFAVLGAAVVTTVFIDPTVDRIASTVLLWATVGIGISNLDRAWRGDADGRRRLRASTRRLPWLLPLAIAGLAVSAPSMTTGSSGPIGAARDLGTLGAVTIIAVVVLTVAVVDPPGSLRRLLGDRRWRIPGLLVTGVLAWYPLLLRALAGGVGSPVALGALTAMAASAAAFVGIHAAAIGRIPSDTSTARRPEVRIP